ncbi:Galactose-proton symporter [Candidatus Annandia adelgestsuga]|uniref:Galactose-proton symporter n=1 Tax=Candidatus Annandia adelgestsuga TaxID=1302411 RepID=A0A3S9J7N7_9ENTR|nr:sugar porter family MFS transporter [Candidatus Annandia adelgestsuga]AZP36267.1 Galactose-proton symporter [Candidatus Annandia adelgestsuga]
MFKKFKKKKIIFFFICFIASLIGLLFGLSIGVITVALPFIIKEFNINNIEQELIVSSMMLGSTLGVLFNGITSFYLGRKNNLIISSLFFIFGSILSSLSFNYIFLLISRIILGIALGIASYTTPLYLSEISFKENRGSIISLYQLMITIGILLSYIFDTMFSYNCNWRYMFGIISIPSFFLLIGIFFLPDSPRWLLSKKKTFEAKNVLLILRNNKKESIKELYEIKDNLKIRINGIKLFINNKKFRKIIFLGILLQIMQQFTGINIIICYAPKMLNMIGFNKTIDQMYCTITIGIINVLSTIIAIMVVDKLGRKPTLIFGFLIMFISMNFLGILLYINKICFIIKYLFFLFILIFISGFAISAGPLVWVLCSEIQPLKVKDFGITISTITNFVSNIIVSLTFLSLINIIGNCYTFWFYSFLNLLFAILTFYLVPETKGISLENIEKKLFSKKF